MIFTDMTNEDYHAHPAISRSGVLELLKSPYHYYMRYLSPDKEKKEPTKAMDMGNAFHTMILEPEKFNNDFIVKPAPVLLKDVGREVYDIYKNALDNIEKMGKTVLSVDDMSLLEKMQKSINAHPDASRLITGGIHESSLFWVDEHTGIECKARPDIWHEEIVTDLKTITSADRNTFQRSIVDGGYHIQAAMIREAIRQNTGKDVTSFTYIVCEKTFPYATAVYILDEATLEQGHCAFKNCLLELKRCIENNAWPAYETQTISLPTWAIK